MPMQGQDTSNPLNQPVGDYINTVYGSTAKVITRPAGYSRTVLESESKGFRIKLGDCTTKTFGTVTPASDTVHIVGHGLAQGQGPVRVANSAGALPAGLAAATDYWIIKVDADNIKFASSLALAQAGTAIDLTDAGSGTNTIVASTPAALAPSAAITNGGGSSLLAEGKSRVIDAQVVTVIGFDAAAILTYYWL